MADSINEPMRQQLVKDLYKQWQGFGMSFEINSKSLTRRGSEVIQNLGHPNMPALTTKDVIEYVKTIREQLEKLKQNIDRGNELMVMTAKFLQKYAVKK